MEDYYVVLGIRKNASEDEVRQAYKKLALQYHPDISADNRSGGKFREITAAYEILNDPLKRIYYNKKIGNDANPYFDLRKEKGNFRPKLQTQQNLEGQAIREQDNALFFSVATLGLAAGGGYGSLHAYHSDNDFTGNIFLAATLILGTVGAVWTKKIVKKRKEHQEREKELETLIKIFSK